MNGAQEPYPQWLLDMAELLHTEDNRATRLPVWQVLTTHYLPAPEGMGDGYVQVANDYTESWGYQETRPEPEEGCFVAPMWAQDRVDQTFFTYAAALQYVRTNRHNLNDPRIYAASGHRNQEMMQLVNWIKSLRGG